MTDVGSFMLIYHELATLDSNYRARLLKGVPSPLAWNERLLNAFDPLIFNRAAAAKRGQLFEPWIRAPIPAAMETYKDALVVMRSLAELVYTLSSPCLPKLALFAASRAEVPEMGEPVEEDVITHLVGGFNPELEEEGLYRNRVAILKQVLGKLRRVRAVLLFQYGRIWGQVPGEPSFERAILFFSASTSQHESALQMEGPVSNRPFWVNMLRLTPMDELSSTLLCYQILSSCARSVEYAQRMQGAQGGDPNAPTADTSSVLSRMENGAKSKPSKKRRGEALVPAWVLPTFAVAIVSISVGAFFLGRILKPRKKIE